MLNNNDYEFDDEILNKRVNIFELLPPLDLYNKNESISNYLYNGYFDTYNMYPEIYKNIGEYLFNNYFLNKREDICININTEKIYQIGSDVFQYLISQNNYTKEQYPLLHDIILIVILDEFERNNYRITD